MEKSIDNLDGKMLKNIIEQFSDAWAQKLLDQRNVPTFHDLAVKKIVDLFLSNSDSIPWHLDLESLFKTLEQFIPREKIESFISLVISWHKGRFVDFETRLEANDSNGLKFLNNLDRDKSFSMSQGRYECLKWKDIILLKTVYDLAIYQMVLWELKPKTIIEIGSGSGGSAVWFSDIMNTYDLDCEIISLDISPPDVTYKDVTFLKVDCEKIESTLNPELFKGLRHPVLIIEDAHVNVRKVLNYFHDSLQPGDYLIVEDSESKQEDIGKFLDDQKGSYKVDSMYCDFFGRNMSCCDNSIFRRA